MKIFNSKETSNHYKIGRILESVRSKLHSLMLTANIEENELPREAGEALLKARLHMLAADMEIERAFRYQRAFKGQRWIVIQGDKLN